MAAYHQVEEIVGGSVRRFSHAKVTNGEERDRGEEVQRSVPDALTGRQPLVGTAPNPASDTTVRRTGTALRNGVFSGLRRVDSHWATIFLRVAT